MIVRCSNCHRENEVEADSSWGESCCQICGSSLSIGEDPHSTVTEVPTETQFGHFKLIRVLGNGAFGTVWQALDEKLDRTVAIKMPRQKTLGTPEVARFLREARAAAQLRHPHLVPVHEVGEYDSVPYIVSDYIEGVHLKAWYRSREPSFDQISVICEKIARAVHEAHEHGIIHRDLKPSNIMVDLKGEPHVMDFGLAKRDVPDATMTVDGAIIGTPSYMPPEQAQGQGHSADRPSDVYALVVSLFEMLTGELPFRGNRAAVFYKLMTEDPPRPRSLNDRIPADLETICMRCLEKDPARRYQTCLELAEELERFRRGFPVKARPIGTVGRILRWYARNPKASILTAGGYMFCFMFVLTIWCLVGLVFIGTGIHPVERPLRAVTELIVLAIVLYLPGLISSIQILNGKFRAIWFNLVVLIVSGAMTLAIFLGLNPEMELLDAAQSSHYAQYQLGSLLGTIVMLGLLLHLSALLSLRRLGSHQTTI